MTPKISVCAALLALSGIGCNGLLASMQANALAAQKALQQGPNGPNQNASNSSTPGSNGSGSNSDAPQAQDHSAGGSSSSEKSPFKPMKAAFPDLDTEKLADLGKLKEVFLAAKPENLVMSKNDEQIAIGYELGSRTLEGDDQEIEKGHVVGVYFDGLRVITLDYTARYKIPAGTPFLVWDTPPGQIIAFSPDGIPHLFVDNQYKPYDASAAWPALSPQVYLAITDLHHLGDIGALPKDLYKTMSDAVDAADKCADDTFEPFQKQVDALDLVDMHQSTRVNRQNAITAQGLAVVVQNCKRYSVPIGKAMRKGVDLRRAQQKELYAAVRTKFGK